MFSAGKKKNVINKNIILKLKQKDGKQSKYSLV